MPFDQKYLDDFRHPGWIQRSGTWSYKGIEMAPFDAYEEAEMKLAKLQQKLAAEKSKYYLMKMTSNVLGYRLKQKRIAHAAHVRAQFHKMVASVNARRVAKGGVPFSHENVDRALVILNRFLKERMQDEEKLLVYRIDFSKIRGCEDEDEDEFSCGLKSYKYKPKTLSAKPWWKIW